MGPEGHFILLVRCVHPLHFLPKGQIIAQAITLPGLLSADGTTPTVCWTEVVGSDKPLVQCQLRQGADRFHVTGMMDTGGDVTVIPTEKWPSQWELQPQGIVSRIGGTQLACQSKRLVQLEGPDGRVATICPFVLDTKFTLCGRDAMSQWGTTITINPKPQGF